MDWLHYVLSDVLKADLVADKDVDSIAEWWAFNEPFDAFDLQVLDETNIQPDAWSFSKESEYGPLWTTKERAEQALKEIERWTKSMK